MLGEDAGGRAGDGLALAVGAALELLGDLTFEPGTGEGGMALICWRSCSFGVIASTPGRQLRLDALTWVRYLVLILHAEVTLTPGVGCRLRWATPGS